MSTEAYYNFFLKNALFKGLSQSGLNTLCSISQEIFLKKGDYLMKEGDEAHEIFFILEGNLEVIKHDEDTKTHYAINRLSSGDIVGELTLFEEERRSAFVCATTDTRLLKVAFEDLQKLIDKKEDISAIYFEIVKRTNQKLRQTTDIVVTTLKKQLEEYKNRVYIGQFFVYTIMIVSIFAYGIMPLKHVVSVISNSSYISIPMILFISIFAFIFIYSSRLPLSTFGITMVDWKRAITEGFLFTLPILALLVFFKWLIIQFFSEYKGHHLFEPFTYSRHYIIAGWVLGNLVYCLFVPVQELMARGVLQGLLEKFLIGRWRVWTAIFVSNLVFSIGHIFLSDIIGVVVFIVGIYLGWLYSRTHNLLGVILAHCLIGIWGFSVVGIAIPK